MITIEAVNHDDWGKTVRRMDRYSEEGENWIRIEFTDGTHVDIEEFIDATDEVPEVVKGNEAGCAVCGEADANIVRDQRNLAVITLSAFVCPALEIEEDDYEKKIQAVRKWARGLIDDRLGRLSDQAKRDAARAERAAKKGPKQEKYFGAGQKEES